MTRLFTSLTIFLPRITRRGLPQDLTEDAIARCSGPDAAAPQSSAIAVCGGSWDSGPRWIACVGAMLVECLGFVDGKGVEGRQTSQI